MQRITHHAVGVCQGSRLLFSACEDHGVMWSGEGQRVERQAVTFPEPFRDPPSIHVSIGMWDIGNSANQRADIRAEQVTASGFDIVFRTWGDTKVARIRAEWMAIGPVGHDSDFIL